MIKKLIAISLVCGFGFFSLGLSIVLNFTPMVFGSIGYFFGLGAMLLGLAVISLIEGKAKEEDVEDAPAPRKREKPEPKYIREGMVMVLNPKYKEAAHEEAPILDDIPFAD